MAYPPGSQTVGRKAIRAFWESVFADERPVFTPEEPLPTLSPARRIALTSTAARGDAGARAQVVRRQPDGTWLRILDQPELFSADASAR